MSDITDDCLRESRFTIEKSMHHLRRLNVGLDRTQATIDSATKIIAAAETTVPQEAPVADDYERRLRTAARIMEIMSAAGFRCQLRHGVTLH
jgi:hypothetical protein